VYVPVHGLYPQSESSVPYEHTAVSELGMCELALGYPSSQIPLEVWSIWLTMQLSTREVQKTRGGLGGSGGGGLGLGDGGGGGGGLEGSGGGSGGGASGGLGGAGGMKINSTA
jgi:hypothetical protein